MHPVGHMPARSPARWVGCHIKGCAAVDTDIFLKLTLVPKRRKCWRGWSERLGRAGGVVAFSRRRNTGLHPRKMFAQNRAFWCVLDKEMCLL